MLAVCGTMMFSACSDDDDDKGGGSDKNVPQNVLKTFAADFGDVKNVQWEQKSNYYVARFNAAPIRAVAMKYNTSAWYDAAGKRCQVEQDVDAGDIPVAVKTAYEAYKKQCYPDWIFDECEVLDRAGMGLVYVIEIEKGEQERELTFSPAGDLLKDVLDEDDDEDDLWPVEIPEGVKTVLDSLFPGNTLLELEIEKDGLEADILDKGRHKEVKLDRAYNWVSTEYDVTMAEAIDMIDAEVLGQLKEMASQAEIDIMDPETQKEIEVEVVEDAVEGLYFKIELDYQGNEVDVIVDKEGNIRLGD